MFHEALDSHLYALMLSGSLHVVLSLFIIWKSPRNKLCLSFAVLNILVASLLLGDAYVYSSANSTIAVARSWAYEAGICLAMPTFLLFIIFFIEPERKSKIGLALVASTYIWATTLFILDRTSLVHQKALRLMNGFYLKAIPIQYFLITLIILCFASCIFFLTLGYRDADLNRRLVYRFIMVGTVFSVLPFFSYIAAPVGVVLPPVGYIGSLMLTAIIAFLISKYQFLDIAVIIKKSLVYSTASAIVVGIYVSVIFAFQQWFQISRYGNAASLFLMATFGVLIAIVFEPLRSVIQRFVDKRFFKTHYDYRESIKEFSRMVVTILDLDKLLHKTAETIRQTLQLDQVVVFLKDPETGEFGVAAFIGGDESIIANWSYAEESELVKALKAAEQSVILDREHGADHVVMSLTIDNEIRGFLILGEKLSGDVYTPNDIDLLSTLADQLSIAVENAQLYHAAVTDKASRLFSGTYFYDRLEDELARSKEHRTSLGIIMLDIDGFTLINDREGSAVADYIITAIGAEIESEIRQYDIAARVGDDEFAILLPGVKRDEIHFRERKMQESVARLKINGEVGLVSVSAGSAYTENGLKPSRRLLNEAKRALIRTKSRGKASRLYS